MAPGKKSKPTPVPVPVIDILKSSQESSDLQNPSPPQPISVTGPEPDLTGLSAEQAIIHARAVEATLLAQSRGGTKTHARFYGVEEVSQIVSKCGKID